MLTIMFSLLTITVIFIININKKYNHMFLKKEVTKTLDFDAWMTIVIRATQPLQS